MRNLAPAQIAKSEQESAWPMQQRYDRAFMQCLYAKGHRVPISGRAADFVEQSQAAAAARTPPPPPPGKPPAEAPPDYRPAPAK